MSNDGAQLVLSAASGFDSKDPRWLEEVEEFHEELRTALRKEDAKLLERALPEAGQKGGAVEIILALGTSGALGVALTAFRAWLERDKRRSLSLQLKTREGVKGFSIEGASVDSGMLDELARAAMRELTKS